MAASSILDLIGRTPLVQLPRLASKPSVRLYAKLELLRGRKWKHGLGDGKSSERIYQDVVKRLLTGTVAMHRPRDYHLDIRRSYREDGIKLPVRKAAARKRR